MAKKKVPNIIVWPDNISELLLIFEPNAVQAWHIDIKRRMVHEQENGIMFMGLQDVGQPVTTVRTVATGMSSRLYGIQKYKHASLISDRVLDKAILVHGGRGEPVTKILSIVVIANHRIKIDSALVY